MTVEIKKPYRRGVAARFPVRDTLPELAEPPPGLWGQLRRILEREGLIHGAPPLPAGVLPFRRK